MVKELPKGWVETNIEQISEKIFAGGDVPKHNYSDDKNEIYQVPIYGNGAKNDGLYGYTNEGKVDFPCVTISARGTIGYTVLRKKEFYPIVRLIVLKPWMIIDLKFVKYVFDSITFENSGSSIPQLTVPMVKLVRFPLPPKPEQERIVAKLDSLFAELERVKEGLAKIPVLMKNFRQAVLTQAVTGKLTEEWRVGKELGEWENLKLKGHTTKIGSGSTPRGGAENYEIEGIPLVRSMNIHFNGIKLTGLAFLNDEQAHALKNVIIELGDILLNITGASIGRVCLADESVVGGRVNQHVCIIRPTKKIDRKYLNVFLSSSIIQNFILSENYGVTRQALTKTQIENLEIYTPHLKEQQEIVRRVEALFAQADAIEARYTLLKEKIQHLPQAMLAKAFRGELVEQLPTDGDARELLAEIKKMKAGLEGKKVKG